MQDYRVVRTLGRGSFATAFLATKKSLQAAAPVCLKVLHQRLADLSPDEREEAVREAKLLSLFRHPGIVEFRGSFIHENRLVLALEFCRAGTLRQQLLARQGRPYPEEEVWEKFFQIADALHYVHSRHVVLRDLKSENVLATGQDGRVLKLSDFGIALVQMGDGDDRRKPKGTPALLAPEVVKGASPDVKSDVWALGVTLYEVAALRRPFDADNVPAVLFAILRNQPDPLPSHYSPELQAMVSALLGSDPSSRPTLDAVLASPRVAAARTAWEAARPLLLAGEQELEHAESEPGANDRGATAGHPPASEAAADSNGETSAAPVPGTDLFGLATLAASARAAQAGGNGGNEDGINEAGPSPLPATAPLPTAGAQGGPPRHSRRSTLQGAYEDALFAEVQGVVDGLATLAAQGAVEGGGGTGASPLPFTPSRPLAAELQPDRGGEATWQARASGLHTALFDVLLKIERGPPVTAAVWEALGAAFADLGDSERAIVAYRRCLGAGPSAGCSMVALEQLGNLLVAKAQETWFKATREGAPGAALRGAEEALAGSPYTAVLDAMVQARISAGGGAAGSRRGSSGGGSALKRRSRGTAPAGSRRGTDAAEAAAGSGEGSPTPTHRSEAVDKLLRLQPLPLARQPAASPPSQQAEEAAASAASTPPATHPSTGSADLLDTLSSASPTPTGTSTSSAALEELVHYDFSHGLQPLPPTGGGEGGPGGEGGMLLLSPPPAPELLRAPPLPAAAPSASPSPSLASTSGVLDVPAWRLAAATLMQEGINYLSRMCSLGETAERHSLLGSAFKRRAWTGLGVNTSRRADLLAAASHYGAAHDMEMAAAVTVQADAIVEAAAAAAAGRGPAALSPTGAELLSSGPCPPPYARLNQLVCEALASEGEATGAGLLSGAAQAAGWAASRLAAAPADIWRWVQAADAACLRYLFGDATVPPETVVAAYKEQMVFGASDRLRASIFCQLLCWRDIAVGRLSEETGSDSEPSAATWLQAFIARVEGVLIPLVGFIARHKSLGAAAAEGESVGALLMDLLQHLTPPSPLLPALGQHAASLVAAVASAAAAAASGSSSDGVAGPSAQRTPVAAATTASSSASSGAPSGASIEQQQHRHRHSGSGGSTRGESSTEAEPRRHHHRHHEHKEGDTQQQQQQHVHHHHHRHHVSGTDETIEHRNERQMSAEATAEPGRMAAEALHRPGASRASSEGEAASPACNSSAAESFLSPRAAINYGHPSLPRGRSGPPPLLPETSSLQVALAAAKSMREDRESGAAGVLKGPSLSASDGLLSATLDLGDDASEAELSALEERLLLQLQQLRAQQRQRTPPASPAPSPAPAAPAPSARPAASPPAGIAAGRRTTSTLGQGTPTPIVLPLPEPLRAAAATAGVSPRAEAPLSAPPKALAPSGILPPGPPLLPPLAPPASAPAGSAPPPRRRGPNPFARSTPPEERFVPAWVRRRRQEGHPSSGAAVPAAALQPQTSTSDSAGAASASAGAEDARVLSRTATMRVVLGGTPEPAPPEAPPPSLPLANTAPASTPSQPMLLRPVDHLGHPSPAPSFSSLNQPHAPTQPQLRMRMGASGASRSQDPQRGACRIA